MGIIDECEGSEVIIKKHLEKITSSVSVDVFLGPRSWDYKLWGEDISNALIKFTADLNKVMASGFLPYMIFGK